MEKDINNSNCAEQFLFTDPPAHWNSESKNELSTLHQISPYIGKLKPQIARDLILSYSNPGDLIVDPFCGSGSIPLEAYLNNRRVIANDVSSYAFLLTEAKLNPPATLESAKRDLQKVFLSSQKRDDANVSEIPEWVKQFFNERTLTETIKFADECIAQKNYFLMACLLGILHHQRPGFLSYPSSHLVPYLRDKKFPRAEFPELYSYRELLPRMAAKISRTYKKYEIKANPKHKVNCGDISNLVLPRHKVDAIITSPPYMNALDYHRDNRLRLWFIDRTTKNYSPEPTDKRAGLQSMVSHLVSQAVHGLKRNGKLVLIVGEMVVRKRLSSHPSSAYAQALDATGKFTLVDAIRDQIPDIRRARREYSGTKAEHILVYEKIK
jgi:DNA modification methylase